MSVFFFSSFSFLVMRGGRWGAGVLVGEEWRKGSEYEAPCTSVSYGGTLFSLLLWIVMEVWKRRKLFWTVLN